MLILFNGPPHKLMWLSYPSSDFAVTILNQYFLEWSLIWLENRYLILLLLKILTDLYVFFLNSRQETGIRLENSLPNIMFF